MNKFLSPFALAYDFKRMLAFEICSALIERWTLNSKLEMYLIHNFEIEELLLEAPF